MTQILVIEDQEILREEILEILQMEEFQAIGAENGNVGVRLAQENQPDLILCDVMMPELDGHGVLAALRQDPATASIPFVFLTAKADRYDLRQGMKLGADDYLTKPFTRAELLETIAAQFKKHAAVDRTIQHKLNTLRSSITLSLPHELHTPLSAILGMSELMLEGFETIEPDEALEMIDTIHSSAERLYRLTQNFLLYAELELIMADPARVADLRHQQEKIDSRGAIADAAMGQAEKAERAGDLQLELQEARVAISDLYLQKIVEEITNNAFKFSTVGTPVQVSSRVDGDQFILSVLNYGRGMSIAQIANIGAYMQFERRLHEQQGSGLGLIIAQRMIELHDGKLIVESNLNGQTTVQVVLKLT